jgi:L-arabinose isomerase
MVHTGSDVFRAICAREPRSGAVASRLVTTEHFFDFAAMSGVEFLMIDKETRVDAFRERLHWNDLNYDPARGL